jgi:hypothetical protein
VDGQYFISTNIDVADGLFNGATGALKEIDFSTKQPDKPVRAWMHFHDNLIGLSLRTKEIAEAQRRKNRCEDEERSNYLQQTIDRLQENWVPVHMMKRTLSYGRGKGLQIVRMQIPLVSANGMTICKSQGSTIPGVVVCLKRGKGDRRVTREELYVSCSRAPSDELLWIDGVFVPPAAPPPDDPVTLEMIRLRKRPQSFAIKFLQDFGNDFCKVYFHNVESLVAHFLDVQADQCPMSADYLALVEPHLMENVNLEIPGFTCIHRTNCRISNPERPVSNSEGVVLFKNGRNYQFHN